MSADDVKDVHPPFPWELELVDADGRIFDSKKMYGPGEIAFKENQTNELWRCVAVRVYAQGSLWREIPIEPAINAARFVTPIVAINLFKLQTPLEASPQKPDDLAGVRPSQRARAREMMDIIKKATWQAVIAALAEKANVAKDDYIVTGQERESFKLHWEMTNRPQVVAMLIAKEIVYLNINLDKHADHRHSAKR